MTTIQVIGRFLTKAIIGLSLAFVLLLGLSFAGMVGYEYFTRIPFNATEWKAGEKSSDKALWRGRMVADLTSRYELEGMHRDEVIKLLGEPDIINGAGPLMGWLTGVSVIDPLYFIVRLNDEGGVVGYDTDVNGDSLPISP